MKEHKIVCQGVKSVSFYEDFQIASNIMEILHFYLCFFPSLCSVLTRKRNICRRHFSVFPTRSNCHFSVNKRASWTRSQVCRSNNEFNESWQELGFLFLTVGEQVEVEIGVLSEKKKRKKRKWRKAVSDQAAGGHKRWGGGLGWRRLAKTAAGGWVGQETQFWCSGLGNVD